MPPQHVEVAETIAALKRALRREREAPSDQQIYSATNRGNKLKRGANYVHSGALPYPHTAEGYKQKIEHAGYARYILDRNPRRYNEYGYELEDSESDTEADADADDENAYSGIRLEELLCPLKSPAELATHPTLSLPFLDPALPDMVLATDARLRQERANLWRAKNLNRQFVGDESWMPLANVEAQQDWDLFEPRPNAATEQSKKRKRGENLPMPNGIDVEDHAEHNDPRPQGQVPADNGNNQKASDATGYEHVGDGAPDPQVNNDVEMPEADPTTNGVSIKTDPTETDLAPILNGTSTTTNDQIGHNTAQSRTSNSASPVPQRRITRALAAEANPSDAPTPPLSPTNTITSTPSSTLFTVDPIFLLPPNLTAPHRLPHILNHLGLPVEELLETRRLLTMYIQKQEESVRGYEAVLAKLIKAKRMRDQLWEWCKTEGHVGEWSDGEDWVDAEAWGVGPGELKKGKDEEEVEAVEEAGAAGRKGKRRRNRE